MTLLTGPIDMSDVRHYNEHVRLTLDLDDIPRVRSTREQVEETLDRLVKQLQPGDQLPPEPDLARLIGISRPTLREVLHTFAERGLLVRRQGVGTFVASRLPILESGLEVLESLNRTAMRLGLATEVLHLQTATRLATEDELLGLVSAAPLEVLVADRVIAIEGEPVADLRDVVPVAYLQEGELNAHFRGSILDLFLERGTPVLGVSKMEISAEIATSELARRLSIEIGTPLLKLTGQLFSHEEQVVDFSTSTFVPGHFRFHVMRQIRS
jgi:GntR family transcriptional regulator